MVDSSADPENEIVTKDDNIAANVNDDERVSELQDDVASNNGPITVPANCEARSSLDDQEYLLKSIDWERELGSSKQEIRIITQNKNGPCPLVAICNVLILRGDLEIRPPDRETVSFEYLVERLGDYLLNHAPTDKTSSEPHSPTELSSSPNVLTSKVAQETTEEPSKKRHSNSEHILTYRHDLDAALSILPRLQSGLDVNVRFSSIYDFEATAELAMFDLLDVELVHGWIADPQDEETYKVVVEKCGSYNAVVNCIVEGSELSSNATDNSPLVEEKIHEGLVADEFLRGTQTQLTYYGIDLLKDTLSKNKLCVLFRNNHFSTLYKHPETERLYILMTDLGLADQRAVVWESLRDVDQGSSQFFNSAFSMPSFSTRDAAPRDDNADIDYAIALSLEQKEREDAAAVRPQSQPSPVPLTGNAAAASQRPQQRPHKANRKPNCVVC